MAQSQKKVKTEKISKAKLLELQKQAEIDAENREKQEQKNRRMLWDLAALLLIVVGAILILAGFGITHGKLVDQSVSVLKRWFGWGRYLVGLLFFLSGWFLLLWRKQPPENFRLSRVILVQLGAFLLLGAVSAFANDSVSTVNAGEGAGGIVGYGLAYPLRSLVGKLPAAIILVVLSIILLVLGLRLAGKIERWAKGEKIESEVDSETTLGKESPLSEFVSLVPEKTEKVKTIKKETAKVKSQMELPLAFRNGSLIDNNKEKKDVPLKPRSDELPPLNLLDAEKSVIANLATINMNGALLEETLGDFGIPAKVVGYRVGPTVTQYAVEPGYYDKGNTEEKLKVRIKQISGLSKDLALALKAERLRIEAPVPGESYVGIEVPNSEHTVVRLKPLLESPEFAQIKSPLAIPLGRGVSGQPVVSDLAGMPHLLIAGTTNSGKSVGMAAITLALVMNNNPDDLKLVMIDPKMVELRRFNGLPHLLGNTETNVDRIMAVLRWATTEMDNRYRLLEEVRARNLDTYNQRMEKLGKARLPRIVILVDELADLMLNAREETELAIVRLAQKARAVGMHLIVATQRPSTDIVTGVIKANFPTRIAFTVASSIDSKVILDHTGAETLLGKGDLLFLHPEVGHPQRAQGVMVSDQEINKVIDWWQKQEIKERGTGMNLNLTEIGKQSVQSDSRPEAEDGGADDVPWETEVQDKAEDDSDEKLIQEATELIRLKRRANASFLQRNLRLGYPRAAWLIDQLEGRGVLGPAGSGKKEREILLPEADDENEERLDE